MSSVVVSFSKLVEKSEGLTPMLHRENILDKKIPERIAALAKEHGGITLEITERDDLFFGDEDDTRWNRELQDAIYAALEEVGMPRTSIVFATISPV